MNRKKYWLLGLLLLLFPFALLSCNKGDKPSEEEEKKQCKVTAVIVHEDGTSEPVGAVNLKASVSTYGITITGLGTYDFNARGAIEVKESASATREVDYITFKYNGGYDYKIFPRTRAEFNSRTVTVELGKSKYYFPFVIKGDLNCVVFTKAKATGVDVGLE